MENLFSSLIVPPTVATKDTLTSGEILEIAENATKDRKHLTFSCEFADLGEGKLYLGHGYRVSSGSWAEITKDTVAVYSYYSYTDPKVRVILPETEHNLKIGTRLTVNIDKNVADGFGQSITLASDGGMFKSEMSGWDGNYGAIFAKVEDFTATKAKMIWTCDGYAKKIWFIGDSYLGYTHAARWPFYLYRDGYAHSNLIGYPGMNTERGLYEFKDALKRATPIYAVWCLGMNNGDPKESDIPNQGWQKATEEFLSICKEKNIIPILSTIPPTPTVKNSSKNEWVKKSGYRYIDFAHAVGADENINWFPDMLHTDLVHPAANGAAALYMQVLIDFPEVMQRN